MWHNDQLLPKWQVVPTMKFEKEMLQELSVDACQAGLFRELRRLHQDFRPPSLVQLLKNHQFEPYPDMHRRLIKQPVHASHIFDGAWTNTDSVGMRITSSMVHIVGVMVVYQGSAQSSHTYHNSRKHEAMHGFDMRGVPFWAQPPERMMD